MANYFLWHEAVTLSGSTSVNVGTLPLNYLAPSFCDLSSYICFLVFSQILLHHCHQLHYAHSLSFHSKNISLGQALGVQRGMRHTDCPQRALWEGIAAHHPGHQVAAGVQLSLPLLVWAWLWLFICHHSVEVCALFEWHVLHLIAT